MPPVSVRGAWALMATLQAALLLAGCAALPPTAAPAEPGSAAAAEPAPLPLPCPSGLPAQTRCLAGPDGHGAHVLMAVPPAWSGVLVVHAHGGPELGPPQSARTVQDLQRWAVVLRAGHAWVGSTYAQGGVALRAAAADTERARRIFVAHVATPRRTLLHGQSWGAGVAAVAAETFASAADGRSPYDAVLLTSGVLAGGSRSYDFRLDLRVVYQHLCGNHPRADEPAYPLGIGLPPGAKLTHQALAARVDDCLGLRQSAALRSAAQAQRLQTLLAVVRIPERSLLGHLNWATWHFQDIAQRGGGRSPFGNMGVRYTGSADDDALNRAVPRYAADAGALERLAADTDPLGRIPVPVLTVHGIDDPVAFVELESTFHTTMAQAGTTGHLVQTFTTDDEHSYLTDAAYLTLLPALLAWVDTGQPPTPAAIAQQCRALSAATAAGCRFEPDYRPLPLASRVPQRQRP